MIPDGAIEGIHTFNGSSYPTLLVPIPIVLPLPYSFPNVILGQP